MSSPTLRTRFHYKDKWVKWIGIPGIAFSVVHISQENSLSQLLHNPSYYADLAFALLVVSSTWYFIKRVIVRLDGYKTWREAPLERAALQLLITLPSVVLLVLVSEALYLEFVLNMRGSYSALFNL